MALKIVYKICCGIDVHKTFVVACIASTDSKGVTTYEHHRFSTYTKGLKDLLQWLLKHNCRDVCMESTGKYWIPVYNVLENDCTIVLAHPKYVKAIRGKKTDKKDAKWIADLFKHDLVAGSFMPPADIRQLRDLMRYRFKLTCFMSSEKNRLQNCLTVSNIQLGNVVSDTFGKSAQAILDKLLENPADMPDVTKIESVDEPWVRATIMMPDKYMGGIMSLCSERRGVQENISYVGNRAVLVYQLPLAEIVFDFYDRVKSISSGYASFDYVVQGYQPSDLVKVSILVNEENVEPLSFMCHRSAAEKRGRQIVEKLKDLIPRHQFKIPLQAAIGGKIIARETIAAYRKDVTAKCYGGDITRKRKLLEKQKEGKKRMRTFGNVEIPQSAFINALKVN